MKAELNKPGWGDLNKARVAYEKNEPRDLFYRVATLLIDQAIEGNSELSITEAVAALLQTWNVSYYRFHGFDNDHLVDIERIIDKYPEIIEELRYQDIANLTNCDQEALLSIFTDFEVVLGPVGAAKCLHLLAPTFFPLWDRAIAEAYGCYLATRGKNADKYYKFMQITREQVIRLGKKPKGDTSLVKAIDEYNYCRYTLKVIS